MGAPLGACELVDVDGVALAVARDVCVSASRGVYRLCDNTTVTSSCGPVVVSSSFLTATDANLWASLPCSSEDNEGAHPRGSGGAELALVFRRFAPWNLAHALHNDAFSVVATWHRLHATLPALVPALAPRAAVAVALNAGNPGDDAFNGIYDELGLGPLLTVPSRPRRPVCFRAAIFGR